LKGIFVAIQIKIASVMISPNRIAQDYKAQFCALLLLFIAVSVRCQTIEQKSQFPELRGAIIMGYSHIPQAYEGEKTVAVIPSWGLDLDYAFNSKWAAVVQVDIKLQSFEVEDENNFNLTRNYPASFCLAGLYQPIPHLSVFLGPGIEYESTRSLWIFKIGTEYSFEISEIFEIGVGIIYENREELYEGWTFGVSFNTRLWKSDKP
jgi:hypothetical protein